jgi:hypothetical protein
MVLAYIGETMNYTLSDAVLSLVFPILIGSIVAIVLAILTYDSE